jgi:hypothetical protein
MRRSEFHGLLFCLSVLAFSWPVINYSNIDRLIIIFKYIFGAWGIIIALLFLISRSLASGAGSEDVDNDRRRE